MLNEPFLVICYFVTSINRVPPVDLYLLSNVHLMRSHVARIRAMRAIRAVKESSWRNIFAHGWLSESIAPGQSNGQ